MESGLGWFKEVICVIVSYYFRGHSCERLIPFQRSYVCEFTAVRGCFGCRIGLLNTAIQCCFQLSLDFVFASLVEPVLSAIQKPFGQPLEAVWAAIRRLFQQPFDIVLAAIQRYKNAAVWRLFQQLFGVVLASILRLFWLLYKAVENSYSEDDLASVWGC